MPIKEGIQYGVNEALTNLRSKPINTTTDLPLATRINLLKDKDPKRYQENMQRLIQAEREGNEDARKLLGEIGEDAGRSRRGYEGLATAMTIAPFAAVAAPYISTAFNNPITQSIFTINGVKNAFTENGVKKTYELFKNGEYLKGVKSGIGDILDIGIPGYQGYKAIKFGKEIYNTLGDLKNAIKIGAMEMPVVNLFQNKSYKIGRELWDMPTRRIRNIPIYHGTSYLGDNFVLSRPEPGLHVGLDKEPAVTRAFRDSRVYDGDNPVVREGYFTYWGKIENMNDKGTNDVLEIGRNNNIKKYDVNNELGEIFKEFSKEVPMYEYDVIPGSSSNGKYNPNQISASSKFIEWLQKNDIDAIKYKNEWEGGKLPSMILLRNKGIHLSKSIPAELTKQREIVEVFPNTYGIRTITKIK